MMDGGGWGGGMGPAGWIMMIVFWVALIALIGFAIVRLFPSRPQGVSNAESPTPTARQLLDERLVRGEIDVESYETLRKALADSTGSG